MTLDEWCAYALAHAPECLGCKKKFEKEEFRHFESPHGHIVDDYKEPQRLYFKCSGCGRGTTLHELTIGPPPSPETLKH